MSPTRERNVPTLEERLAHLLAHAGDPGVCRGCQTRIVWIVHRSGARVPYVADGANIGINHFIDCPRAKDFQRKKS